MRYENKSLLLPFIVFCIFIGCLIAVITDAQQGITKSEIRYKEYLVKQEEEKNAFYDSCLSDGKKKYECEYMYRTMNK